MKRVYTQVGEVLSHSSNRTYKISEDQYGNLSCECMAFRYQPKPVNERTCKHIEEFLARQVPPNNEEVILV